MSARSCWGRGCDKRTKIRFFNSKTAVVNHTMSRNNTYSGTGDTTNPRYLYGRSGSKLLSICSPYRVSSSLHFLWMSSIDASSLSYSSQDNISSNSTIPLISFLQRDRRTRLLSGEVKAYSMRDNSSAYSCTGVLFGTCW
jgi:hypothetical protein